MKLAPMLELMLPAWKGKYAVPAFCAWNAEVTDTILQVASDLGAPVILMSGPGAPAYAAALAAAYRAFAAAAQ